MRSGNACKIDRQLGVRQRRGKTAERILVKETDRAAQRSWRTSTGGVEGERRGYRGRLEGTRP